MKVYIVVDGFKFTVQSAVQESLHLSLHTSFRTYRNKPYLQRHFYCKTHNRTNTNKASTAAYKQVLRSNEGLL
jgi:hypothetical protein